MHGITTQLHSILGSMMIVDGPLFLMLPQTTANDVVVSHKQVTAPSTFADLRFPSSVQCTVQACVECDITGNSNYCTECDGDYVLLGHRACVSQCPDRFFTLSEVSNHVTLTSHPLNRGYPPERYMYPPNHTCHGNHART